MGLDICKNFSSSTLKINVLNCLSVISQLKRTKKCILGFFSSPRILGVGRDFFSLC